VNSLKLTLTVWTLTLLAGLEACKPRPADLSAAADAAAGGKDEAMLWSCGEPGTADKPYIDNLSIEEKRAKVKAEMQAWDDEKKKELAGKKAERERVRAAAKQQKDVATWASRLASLRKLKKPSAANLRTMQELEQKIATATSKATEDLDGDIAVLQADVDIAESPEVKSYEVPEKDYARWVKLDCKASSTLAKALQVEPRLKDSILDNRILMRFDMGLGCSDKESPPVEAKYCAFQMMGEHKRVVTIKKRDRIGRTSLPLVRGRPPESQEAWRERAVDKHVLAPLAALKAAMASPETAEAALVEEYRKLPSQIAQLRYGNRPNEGPKFFNFRAALMERAYEEGRFADGLALVPQVAADALELAFIPDEGLLNVIETPDREFGLYVLDTPTTLSYAAWIGKDNAPFKDVEAFRADRLAFVQRSPEGVIDIYGGKEVDPEITAAERAALRRMADFDRFTAELDKIAEASVKREQAARRASGSR
jgi:hypothetical protein